MISKELRHTIYPLVLLLKFTGTQHTAFSYNTYKPIEISTVQKLYNLFVGIILLSVSIWSSIGKFMYAYEYQLPLLKTLNVLFQMSLTIGLFLQCVLPFCTPYSLVTVFVNIADTTKQLRYQRNRFMRFLTVGLLAMFHCLAVTFIVFDVSVWFKSFGWNIAKYYICDSIMLYKLTLYSLKFYISLIILRERFRYLNKLLPLSAHNQFYEMPTSSAKYYNMNVAIGPESMKDMSKLIKPPTVRELSRIHETLYKSCIELNHFFAPLIVTLCFEACIMMTQSAYSGVVFGTGVQKPLNPNSSPHFVVGVMICWTFYSLILVVLLTSLCEVTVNTANNTAIIANSILLQDGLNEQTITELIRLAAQIQQQNLKFSAAGLFGINLSTLLQLLGAVSSYIIVAFQFEGLTPTDLTKPK